MHTNMSERVRVTENSGCAGSGESKRTIKARFLALDEINAYRFLRTKPMLSVLEPVGGEFIQCVALFA